MPERSNETADTADTVVVGGGPAGTAAAITLARAGHDVVLVDKALFPRDKFCGDGLTAGALRHLETLGLDPRTIASWVKVDHMVLRTPSGRETAFSLPRHAGTYAAVARRVELDAAMVDLARSAGVRMYDGHACTAAQQDEIAVSLDVAGLGPVRTPYVIAADGMWSPVRKMLGMAVPDYRGEWHAFRQYFVSVSDRAQRELFVSFEPDFLPGYFWSFPVAGGGANVGFGIRRGGKFRVGAMKTLWPELLERPHVRDFLGPDAQPESPHRAWPIPARVDQVQHSAGRALFVGDAAAATDPLTGEGIGQALATGIWAAQAVLEAGPSRPKRATDSYERSVHEGLFADHRMAEVLSRAMSHRKGVRIAVRLAATNDWTRRNFARWLFEDYPRALIVTPRRWRRGMFGEPGAYLYEQGAGRLKEPTT